MDLKKERKPKLKSKFSPKLKLKSNFKFNPKLKLKLKSKLLFLDKATPFKLTWRGLKLT